MFLLFKWEENLLDLSVRSSKVMSKTMEKRIKKRSQFYDKNLSINSYTSGTSYWVKKSLPKGVIVMGFEFYDTIIRCSLK